MSRDIERKLIKDAIGESRKGNGSLVRKLIQSVLFSKVRRSVQEKEKEVAKTLFRGEKE